jgi:hypothetical protein
MSQLRRLNALLEAHVAERPWTMANLVAAVDLAREIGTIGSRAEIDPCDEIVELLMDNEITAIEFEKMCTAGREDPNVLSPLVGYSVPEIVVRAFSKLDAEFVNVVIKTGIVEPQAVWETTVSAYTKRVRDTLNKKHVCWDSVVAMASA